MNGASVTTRKLQSAVIGLGLVAVLFMATFAHGADSPFFGLSGAWTGPGTVTLNNGAKENIRCRANYSVDGSGTNLKLDLRCASEGFKFELQSSVSHNNGEVSGFWNELINRVGGTIAGNFVAKAPPDGYSVVGDAPPDGQYPPGAARPFGFGVSPDAERAVRSGTGGLY